MTFLPGLQLCRIFYTEAVRPLLDEAYPGLPHAAARVGPGSDVLGYDTPRSTDHDWGPRLTLFLTDLRHAAGISELLRQRLPKHVRGYPTHFTPPGARVQVMTATDGPVAHRADISTVEDWAVRQFGAPHTGSHLDWLSTPAQRFLEATSGEVYHDGVGELSALRERLAWYPADVWRYLLAAQWTLIAQEEAFVGRAREAGDAAGAQIVAARLTRHAMRLALLQARRYPPYSKWLGTAYAGLTDVPEISDLPGGLLGLLEELGRRQNALGLCPGVPATRRGYFDRPYQVIGADRYAAALRASLTDPVLAALPLTGAIDQYVDNTDVLTDPVLCRALGEAILEAV